MSESAGTRRGDGDEGRRRGGRGGGADALGWRTADGIVAKHERAQHRLGSDQVGDRAAASEPALLLAQVERVQLRQVLHQSHREAEDALRAHVVVVQHELREAAAGRRGERGERHGARAAEVVVRHVKLRQRAARRAQGAGDARGDRLDALVAELHVTPAGKGGKVRLGGGAEGGACGHGAHAQREQLQLASARERRHQPRHARRPHRRAGDVHFDARVERRQRRLAPIYWAHAGCRRRLLLGRGQGGDGEDEPRRQDASQHVCDCAGPHAQAPHTRRLAAARGEGTSRGGERLVLGAGASDRIIASALVSVFCYIVPSDDRFQPDANSLRNPPPAAPRRLHGERGRLRCDLRRRR